MIDWHVAIYCANEEARLETCLRSALAEVAGRRARITVVLNGCADDSARIAMAAADANGIVDVVTIEAADKANAINQFFHHLRAPAEVYVGVDGYVEVRPGAFAALAATLLGTPHADAASGVAVAGRSMTAASREALDHGGRLHGQLYALRGDFVNRMVARGIQLPVSLYRGDGLLGSMVAHDLDPLRHAWDGGRIVAVAEAEFMVPTPSPLDARDVRRVVNRRIRQMRGAIENEAIKDIIYRGGYEALPADADAMIRDYLACHAPPVVAWHDRLLQRIAIERAFGGSPCAAEQLMPHSADRSKPAAA